MFGSAILEVAIGLVVIYVLFSLICSTVTEGLAQILNLRGKNLVKGIERMLNNSNKSALQKAFFDHPLIKGLDHSISENPKKASPDYVSYNTFTTVVSDILDLPEKTKAAGGDIEEGLKQLPDGDLKVSLLALFSSAQNDIKSFEDRIAHWYDESMNRVAALYKRKAHFINFTTAFLLVLFFNVDSLYFGNYLYQNSNVRQALVAVGEQAVAGDFNVVAEVSGNEEGEADGAEESGAAASAEKKQVAADSGSVDVNLMFSSVMESKLPLGWSLENWELTKTNVLAKILGLLISVFSISLGAPFWFQILNKLVNLKSSGAKPLTMLEEKSNLTLGAN